MKEKIYIVDFDNTILNNKEFKKSIGLYMEKNKDISNNKILKYFDDKNEKFLKFIKNNLKKYFFDGVVEILEELKGDSFAMILLSKGLKDYQLLKISGLSYDLFDDIYIVEKSKVETVKELYNFFSQGKKREIIFINDHPGQNEEIKREFPDIKVVSVNNYPLDYPENKGQRTYNELRKFR